MQELINILEKRFQKKLYKKDNILFFEGENANKFFLLLNGRVRLYKSIDFNKELNIHSFDTLSFIAEMPAFHNMPYPASAICEMDSELLEIDFKEFTKLIQNDNNIGLVFILSLFEKIKILENKLDFLSTDLKNKFIKFLFTNENNLDKIKQKEIASILNTRPESLSRIIKELKNNDLISTQKGKIQILNKQELKKILNYE